MNEQKILTPELEARVHQAVDNFMQGSPSFPSLYFQWAANPFSATSSIRSERIKPAVSI